MNLALWVAQNEWLVMLSVMVFERGRYSPCERKGET
jgi:hypothetical protein